MPLIRPRQVHGASVIVVPRGEATVVTGEADGLICEGGGRLLGVVTADCVPVLVVAPGRRVAGVLHAGWRGMAAGIVSVGLARLRSDLGVRPGEIEVALGPSIDRCCYEVGAVVREALVRGCGEARGVWQRVGSNWRLDLRDLVRVLLEQGGVPARAIHRVGPCTGCAVDRYYSYRREGRGAGRQLSFVGWLSNGLPAAEVMGR